MPANLENSAVATGLEKVSFHSNAKERQCLRMFKLPHSCTYLTHQQSNTQNYPSQPSKVCKQMPLSGFMFKLILEKAEEPEIKLPTSTGSQKKQESSTKTSTYALLTSPTPLTVQSTRNWKILKVMGLPDHLTCLLRNLNAGQEATVRTVHETRDWFKIGKELHHGCILSPCLSHLYKLESRLPGEISIMSDMQMTPPLWQKAKKN